MTQPVVDTISMMQAAIAAVKERPFTGDASLDLLLSVLPAPVSEVLKVLAIPHSFDTATVELLANQFDLDPQALGEAIVDQPFIRETESGLAFHDVVRDQLRATAQRLAPEQFRESCRLLASLHPAPDEELRPEEAADWVEHLYLRLAYDESAALPQVAELFDRARRRRLLGTQHLIVSFTEEQEAILSSTGQAHLQYFRGLTAFDARDFTAARTLLESVDTTLLPARLRQRVALYQGQIWEELGELGGAIRYYQGLLPTRRGSGTGKEADSTSAARIHQRIGMAALALGDLGLAERHARASLRINERSCQEFGLALNRQLLGRIHLELGDSRRARKEFAAALDLLRRLGANYHVAEVLVQLGRVATDTRDFDEAQRSFEEAGNFMTEAVDHFGLASVYAHRARMELARREPQAAINFYEHALSLLRGFREPTRCAILLENIALVHSSRGNWSDAIEFQGRAVETAPTTYARRERMVGLLKEMREILERSKQPWVRRHRIEVLGWGGFLLLLVLLVGGVLAVEGRYEAQVGSAIESIKSTALDSDARVSFDRRSMLTEGEYESHTLRLSPDSVYDIWSVCDNDCGAMALRLSQPSRSEPLESATAAEPHLTFIPEAAGDYTIDADMWECGIGSCYYGLLVIARERQDLPADDATLMSAPAGLRGLGAGIGALPQKAIEQLQVK